MTREAGTGAGVSTSLMWRRGKRWLRHPDYAHNVYYVKSRNMKDNPTGSSCSLRMHMSLFLGNGGQRHAKRIHDPAAIVSIHAYPSAFLYCTNPLFSATWSYSRIACALLSWVSQYTRAALASAAAR